jgi:hypothetical protein
MRNSELIANLKCSIQRALLQQVTARLAAVTCGLNQHEIKIVAYFDGEVTSADIESIQEVSTEVVADFPEGYTIAEECRSLTPGHLEMLDFWAFMKSGVWEQYGNSSK